MSEPDIPENEEEFDDEDMDMEDGFDPMMSILTTEDGDTLATVLQGIRTATEQMANALDTQNKILIKVLSALTPAK
jgi:hypothetical protein